MPKKKPLSKKKILKPKKIGMIFNKVFDEYKKNQRINEKKEIKIREDIIKKEQLKINTKEKDQKIKDEDLKKREDQAKRKDDDFETVVARYDIYMNV